jgi:uncharacterized protein (DUF305 family)
MGALPTRGFLLAIVAALAGCGGSSQQTIQTKPDPQGGVVADEGAPDPYGTRYPPTAADVEFMSGMISHHAQAIAMSKLAPTHGASETIRTLAGRVINAQQDEINLMQQWLRERNFPVPEASPTGMKMVMNGVEHEMLMPGMLTPEQMKQLDAARGPEFDELFLTLMIQHHRGAVGMVEKLFSTPGAGQNEIVFKFASDVNVDQTTEIARMEKTLFMLRLKRANP